MAGIGFALRKLSNREDLSSIVSGFILSAIVAAGPWVLTTVGLLIVSYSSMGYFSRVRDYLLFRSLVTFSFAGTLILVSLIQLPATRFIADRFFEMKFSDNRSIYLTVIGVTLLFGIPIAGLMVFSLDLPNAVRLASFNLMIVLMLLWVTTALVSTLHDYGAVGFAFFAGSLASVFGTLLGARYGAVSGALLGYLMGQGLIVTLLAARIFVEFPGKIFWNRTFVRFLRHKTSLVLLGFVMTLGIWIDKIIYWYAPGSDKVSGFIHINRIYDIGMFFALLTVIPTLALFVFYFETGFYERYRHVFVLLEGKRPFFEILEAKEQMVRFIRRGLGYILKIQGAVTFMVVLNGEGLLRFFHADLMALPVFRMGSLGGLCQVILTMEFTLLLYFNQQNKVERLAWLLLLSNGGLTFLSIMISPRLEGFGYLTACLVSAVYGYFLLDRGVVDFEFTVFMKPPDYTAIEDELPAAKSLLNAPALSGNPSS